MSEKIDDGQPEQQLPDTSFENSTGKKSKPVSHGSRWHRLKDWYLERKKWTVPLTVLLFLLIIAVVPFTRYYVAGLALKKDVSLTVVDSTANTPVSGATVTIGSVSAQADSTGKATLHQVKVGNHKATISKKYYQTSTIYILAPILNQKNISRAQLIATGRQVKVTIRNTIDKTPLKNVNIKAAGTTAKTDSDGSAILVLPVGTSEQKAILSLDSYNEAEVNIKVSNDKIQDNQFTLTPAGKVYFLSKLSGKIDVVKTNLDGTERHTVMAGTGREDDQNTVLLASRDWKYLALLSRRAGNNPILYLIDASNDSASTIDEGTTDLSLTGWVDSNFVYTATSRSVNIWQPGRQIMKSYNALSKKTTNLDQTTASGSGQFDYLGETFGGIYAYNGQVFYIKNWTASYGGSSMSQLQTKQATFNSVKSDGTGKKAIKSFALASGSSSADITVEERVQNPDSTSLKFYDGSKDNFYVYTNGQVKDDANMNPQLFYSSNYPTYLQSPSGNDTFWAEPRDGKNTLFIGNEDGQKGKQIASLSEYFTYGWFTDDYLLVSKNSSELYIMPKGASKNPVKISDYHKPVQNFYGYGGGYGGI